MVSDRCEARVPDTGNSRARSCPSRRSDEYRLVGDQLSAELTALSRGEEIAQWLLQEQSQPAQFGLAAAAHALLELAHRKD
jgi:hypothetical protein